jgi:hypothetical protein
MGRFLSVLLRTAVFLFLLVGIDQLLVLVPASHSAHVAVADFYRDLRGRAFELAKGVKSSPAPAATPAKTVPPAKGREVSPTTPASVEGIVGQRQTQPMPAPKPVAKPPSAGSAPRYVYTDKGGTLHFADTLAEVPEPYRATAKVLGK